MSASGFPGLGFDPAPGSLVEVGALASALASAQKQLEDAYVTVKQVASGGQEWQGDAAKGFARRLGQLPQHLDTAERAFGTAASVLHTWQDQLSGMQNQAQELEAQAETARSGLVQAGANPDLALIGERFTQGQALQEAEERYGAAVAALQAAESELNGLIDQAEKLQQGYLSLAKEVAKTIEQAADMAPPGPGFFAGMLDGLESVLAGDVKLAEDVGDWVKSHAYAIDAVGDMLSTASAALGVVGGVLDCIPGAEPLGLTMDGASSVLSIGALGAHLLAKAGGAPVSDETLLEDGIGATTFGMSAAAKSMEEGGKFAAGAPLVIRALAQGDKFGAALNAAGLSMSIKDTFNDQTGLGYFVPKNGRQETELGVSNLIPGGGILTGFLAVGFENAWDHGSAEDRAHAAAEA